MDVQNIFYTVGIIFMILAIVLMIIIGYVLFVIKQRITQLTQTFEERIQAVTHFVDDPADAAMSIGSIVADTAVKKVKKLFR